MPSFFQRLKEGLRKTREGMVDKVASVVLGYTQIDEDMYEELEEVLIEADLGARLAIELLEDLREEVKERRVSDPGEVPTVLEDLLVEMLENEDQHHGLAGGEPPRVILVVGVNGVGKTTTIGKLAALLRTQGEEVLLAAGDTFRAAAVEQLQAWGERTGAEVIAQPAGSDPAAVVFDAVAAAQARSVDTLIVDTAGRLHNQKNLMNELAKIQRVLDRKLPGAPHEVLLVLDAATGQNALRQVELFKQAVDVSGLVLTKLDGTAKGGIVFAIAKQWSIPVKFIGVGEQVDDLQPFDPTAFVEALFGDQAPVEPGS